LIAKLIEEGRGANGQPKNVVPNHRWADQTPSTEDLVRGLNDGKNNLKDVWILNVQ
jgi:hypothetical protein